MNFGDTISQYATDAAPAVGTLAMAAITWLCVHGALWIKARTKNELVRGFVDRLSSEIQTGVLAAEQTAVADALKAGPKLSKETALQIKSDVTAKVIANLGGDKWLAEAQKVLGVDDIRASLSSKIEAAVLALTPPSPPAPAAKI